MSKLSTRARVAIGAIAVFVGVTYGWLTTPHLHPDRYGVTVERIELEGREVGDTRTLIAVRSQRAGDSAVVLLHGRGSSPDETLSDELFEALEGAGDEAPVVLLPDGGESSYWHDRASGRWASYLTEEVIPTAVERFGVDDERVAIGGISMGGFGALSLWLDSPERFCAVGGHSPAIFRSWEDAASGAFDDADDFERHDILDRSADAPAGVPVWIDVGSDDPFRSADVDLAERLKDAGVAVQLHLPAGGHDDDYWRAHMDEYVDFYAGALRDC